MKRYRLYGAVVASAHDLPELEPAPGAEPAWQVEWETARSVEPERWLREFRFPDGQVWLSSGRVDGGYLLRFHDLADFLVTATGEIIRCHPVAGTPPETLRHLLLDQVIPRLLPLRGLVALHAGAILAPGGAVGFLGETGQGKSTLAASFARAGFALLADDCLALSVGPDGIEAVGAYPGLRLWPDTVSVAGSSVAGGPVAHYSDKQRLGPGSGLGFSPGPARLGRLYVLDESDGEDARVERLDPPAGLLELLKGTYRMGGEEREMLEREFTALTRLVAGGFVRRLRVPRDLALLPRVHDAVMADLSSGV
jgi:hypothetical protein